MKNCAWKLILVSLFPMFASLSTSAAKDGFCKLSTEEGGLLKIEFSQEYKYAEKSYEGETCYSQDYKTNDRYCELAKNAARVISKAYQSKRFEKDWQCSEEKGEIKISGVFSQTKILSHGNFLLNPHNEELTEAEKDFLRQFTNDLIASIVDGNPLPTITPVIVRKTSTMIDSCFACRDPSYVYNLWLGDGWACCTLL